MGRGSAVILAIAIVVASLIIGGFNRYEIIPTERFPGAYRLDKLTGRVSHVDLDSVSPLKELRE